MNVLVLLGHLANMLSPMSRSFPHEGILSEPIIEDAMTILDGHVHVDRLRIWNGNYKAQDKLSLVTSFLFDRIRCD